MSKYIITLIDTNDSIQNITKKVTEILKNIERDVIFLTNQDNAETEANIIQQRINVNVPNSLIITSSRGAIRIHEDVLRLLGEKINSNYKMQSTYDTQENPIEMITFINKTS